MGESPQGQSDSGVQQATGGSGGSTTSHPKICSVCGEPRGDGPTCQTCGSR
jgi:hypothetical protein